MDYRGREYNGMTPGGVLVGILVLGMILGAMKACIFGVDVGPPPVQKTPLGERLRNGAVGIIRDGVSEGLEKAAGSGAEKMKEKGSTVKEKVTGLFDRWKKDDEVEEASPTPEE